MHETSQLAEFLSDLRYEDLPSDVVDTAKLCILDAVGVALGASEWPWSRIVADQVASSDGAKEATVWGRRLHLPAQQAALANATAAHGIEMDDRSPVAQLHPGAMLVPAALALAEKTGATGRTLLTAVVAGYELGMRVGYAIRFKQHGAHWAAHKGVWPAVGAAAKALGLNHEQTQNAFGLAGSVACGLGEFSRDPRGTMVKRLHAGLASSHGVLAAELGQRGLTGPGAILEGAYGYCTVYAFGGEPDLDELVRGLGSDYRIMHREVKPYASWGGGHNAIDAVAKILAARVIDPDQIRRIRIGGSQLMTATHSLKEPGSIMAAQYSLPFLTALALTRGPYAMMNPRDVWIEDVLSDPIVARLVARTEVYVDPRLEELALESKHYGGARVTVEMVGKATYEAVVNHSKGTRENPMTAGEIEAKFRRIARTVLSEERCDEIVDSVQRLDDLDNARRLTELLA
jgi:aconitate decarboxylase